MTMVHDIVTLPTKDVFKAYPGVEDFFQSMGMPRPAENVTMLEYTAHLDEEILEDKGLVRSQLILHFKDFVAGLIEKVDPCETDVRSITITGGHDKSGQHEEVTLTLTKGDVVSVVGPTGSGKSRLLADIEWMAQGDTQTGRSVLINEKPVDTEWRYSSNRRIVAQLSQNMNFIVDLSVREFVAMHAQARRAKNIDPLVCRVIDTANTIAGEPISAETRVTALSGGQSRALMIADTALVSYSPIVLIDEIENAGIDRRKALDLLVEKQKIVLVATHDPVLALMADRRIVLKNGGILKVLKTTSRERENLAALQHVDSVVLSIRNAIRDAETVETSFWELVREASGNSLYRIESSKQAVPVGEIVVPYNHTRKGKKHNARSET
ncbi:ATP-binding cassette domain-containing protein [Syntrophorhabdus aromaticivorans]|nr:ATP-binding cassette domain-containing protein [Syntrophorhabdus aromaticivorans]